MSKHPTPAETRWRQNQRYRRMLATLLSEEAIGDPLGCHERARRSGMIEAIQWPS